MKIRYDFVTNSSSSSFIVFNIDNEKLAKICKENYIPVDCDGNIVSGNWSAEDCSGVIGTPEFGSLAEWFEKLIDPNKNPVIELEGEDFSYAIDCIEEHKEEIDKSTKKSSIESYTVETDCIGENSVDIERRENGTIWHTVVNDGNWDYTETGSELWELLEDAEVEDVIQYAKKHGMIETKPDSLHDKRAVTKTDTTGTAEDNQSPKNNYDPIQFEGKKFVTTLLSSSDEIWVKEKVESKGGVYKPHFVVSLDYLIFNSTDFDITTVSTVKLDKAREQIKKGKDVKIIPFDKFKKMCEE